MRKSAPPSQMDQILARYSTEVLSLALATRTFVMKMLPDITEQPDTKAGIIGYGYGPKYRDMVCMIMPTKAGVNLGIAYAMELPDSGKLLEGTGKLHRHVKLKAEADLESSALRTLLKAASAAAIRRRESPPARAKK